MDVVTSGLEFLRTPVKQFAKYDYKKLQTFVAAMGLPSNLKRKQLLAIIVAKKMGKDDMIPAIMKEVNRQRSQRKKMLKVAQQHKMYAHRTFPPKFAPLPPQVISQKATPVPNFIFSSGGLVPPVQRLNYQPCFGYPPNQPIEYYSATRRDRQPQKQGLSNKPATITSGSFAQQAPESDYPTDLTSKYQTIAIEYNYDGFITKRVETRTIDVKITTRCILHMEPSTCTTPWYHQVLNSSQEKRFDSKMLLPPSSPAKFPTEGSENQIPDQMVDSAICDCKKGTEDISLDEILDYVMGDKEKSFAESDNSVVPMLLEDDTTTSSCDSEIEVSQNIHDIHLHYYLMIASRSLWPLKAYTYTYGKSTDSIFDCLSPISSDTNPTYTRAYHTICHSFEVYSSYRHGVYYQSLAQGNVSEQQMLQNTNMTYGDPRINYCRPRMYAVDYSSSSSGTVHCQSGQEERMASSTQYGDHNIDPSTNASFVELKPVIRRLPENLADVEPTIVPMTPEEEMYAYNSLGDVNSINIDINDRIVNWYQDEHETYCCTTKMPCPFIFTYCNWFDNIPSIAKHIRLMHSEKIVTKRSAEYYINFVHLENLRDKSVKIIQEYNDRLFYIALWAYEGYFYITIQEMCENVEQHLNKLKASLIMRHPSGLRSWTGHINAMYVPPFQLWKPETALIVSIQHLKACQGSHFRLYVNIGI